MYRPKPRRIEETAAGPPRAAPFSVRLLLAAPLIALTGCEPAVLSPAGPVAAGELKVLLDSLALMLTIVVPTVVAIFAVAWWFRASNPRAKRLPDWAFSGQLELVIWAVPLLTIMFLGGLTWIASHRLDPGAPLASKQKPMNVQVVSLDWKWLFIYPEAGVASVNTLVIPTGVPIRFSLTSASVMNAFFVPRLGTMIYTMNGMTTRLNLQADAPGVYPGLSSHFSGDGFAGMRFDVHAVPQAAFDGWVAAAKGAGPALDAAAYAQLARQSADVSPFTYRAAAPGLFQAIATQAVAPAPGPQTAAPQSRVSPKPLGGR